MPSALGVNRRPFVGVPALIEKAAVGPVCLKPAYARGEALERAVAGVKPNVRD